MYQLAQHSTPLKHLYQNFSFPCALTRNVNARFVTWYVPYVFFSFSSSHFSFLLSFSWTKACVYSFIAPLCYHRLSAGSCIENAKKFTIIFSVLGDGTSLSSSLSSVQSLWGSLHMLLFRINIFQMITKIGNELQGHWTCPFLIICSYRCHTTYTINLLHVCTVFYMCWWLISVWLKVPFFFSLLLGPNSTN